MDGESTNGEEIKMHFFFGEEDVTKPSIKPQLVAVWTQILSFPDVYLQ